MSERTYGFETLAVHAGAAPDPTTGARATPIYQTTSYVFDDVDHAAALFNLQKFGNIYSRLTNPTVSVLEERVAALEGGTAACATASGHSAQFLTFLNLMSPGDHIVASSKLYGGSISQMRQSFPQFDWKVSFVDPTEPENFAKAVTPSTKAFFIESASNPDGIIADIEAIATIAHANGVPLVVDNTIPSPYLCQPLKWGADIVVHSMTKYLGGQGNSVGGIIVEGGNFDWNNGKFPHMSEPCAAYHGLRFYETFGNLAFTVRSKAIGLRDIGPALAPLNAFLILQGIETLPLRMDRHVANADKVAAWLAKQPQVAWVSYARLPQNRSPLLDKYCPNGLGSLFTFGVKGGYEAGVKVVDSCELLSHVANIGDTRSLIIHPASTTHRQLDPEQQVAAGAGPDTIRISVGIESADDIIADLQQALSRIG
ncbi:O-acetylhomoserine aminocarboxypropyltransferase [Marinimicrococcus flavescens]|uniref:O-acetylhomoserine aminocarboxypropyltransferase n=1 Tax=Marinimicrococcus flavescens TaxID=3031815 RepID=A0AAP3XR34_9PROT|nr:O-acetylhomoserine aminocarboxypropyltransferase [Marinimicrococcus flavescens]